MMRFIATRAALLPPPRRFGRIARPDVKENLTTHSHLCTKRKNRQRWQTRTAGPACRSRSDRRSPSRSCETKLTTCDRHDAVNAWREAPPRPAAGQFAILPARHQRGV